MHIHLDKGIFVDAEAFEKLMVGRIGLAIDEGFQVFDLNSHEVEIKLISEQPVGLAQVITAFPTRISSLDQFNQPLTLLSLPVDQILREAGFPSKAHLRRELIHHRYPNKTDIDWITVIFFRLMLKYKEYPCPECRSKNVGFETMRIDKSYYFICNECGSSFRALRREEIYIKREEAHLSQRFPKRKKPSEKSGQSDKAES